MGNVETGHNSRFRQECRLNQKGTLDRRIRGYFTVSATAVTYIHTESRDRRLPRKWGFGAVEFVSYLDRSVVKLTPFISYNFGGRFGCS
jgi:hypothetical protein